MFIHTSNSEPATDVLNSYHNIKSYAMELGYSNPIGFIKDYILGRHSEIVPTSNKQIEKTKLPKIFSEKANLIGVIIHEEKSLHNTPSQDIPGNKIKKSAAQETTNPKKEESFPKEKITKPEKLRRESVLGSPIGVPGDIKAKIVKFKRASKYYREMTFKKKGIDCRFDYFLMKPRRVELGKFFHDSRSNLGNFLLIENFFDDFEKKFRKIMAEIYSHNKNLVKKQVAVGERNKYVQEVL